MKNLGGTLYDEIARSATETLKNCYEGKVEVTRKALSPLKSRYDKLMGLTFIEPKVSPIASIINTALESIPKRGPITGSTLLMLHGLVSILYLHANDYLRPLLAQVKTCFPIAPLLDKEKRKKFMENKR